MYDINDEKLYSIAKQRMSKTHKKVLSEQEVLETLGISSEELDDSDEVDIE